VVLSVADHGPGLPPGVEERVFDRFYKADEARTRGAADDSGQGSGLGTAIALENALLHGGTIEAAGAAGAEDAAGAIGGPGRGAVFTLRLPLRRTGEDTE
jgi:two-component system sensor histidine kinase MtrB